MKVFPSKHILLSETCYGLGGLIMQLYELGDDINGLFNKYQKNLYQKGEQSDSMVNNFYLTLAYLYALDIIEIDNNLVIEL